MSNGQHIKALRLILIVVPVCAYIYIYIVGPINEDGTVQTKQRKAFWVASVGHFHTATSEVYLLDVVTLQCPQNLHQNFRL